MPIDVFISYSRIDLAFVIALDAFLTRAGVSVWFDKKSLLPGKKWEEVIEDQIESASVFLTCLSQAGLDKRGYFHVEQNLAVQAALRMPPEKLYVMPVTLGECPIPRQFRQYNVSNLAEHGSIESLLAALSEALERHISAAEDAVVALRNCLLEHIGVEGASNDEFERRFLDDEISFETSASLIQRIANSADGNKLKRLLLLRQNADISYAEERALDIAIDHVKRGLRIEGLQAQAVAEERAKISQMGGGSNTRATPVLQANKYARFTSRKNSAAYAMAEKAIHEIIAQLLAANSKYDGDTPMDTNFPRGTARDNAIRLARLGHFSEGMDAANAALLGNRSLTTDPKFVFALARCSAGLGDLKTSIMALQVLLAKNELAQHDPELPSTLQFLQERGLGPEHLA
jgi:hypothetical protein